MVNPVSEQAFALLAGLFAELAVLFEDESVLHLFTPANPPAP
jgi:hypothetical protein